MAKTIQEFANEREVKLLVHFTRASNLSSILERGLVTRDTLILEGNNKAFNDHYRHDGTHAVCLSIGFPNYKMFWGLRKDYPDVEWVILAIHSNVLWDRQCAFCTANAASAAVTGIPLQQRMSAAAFAAMYENFEDKIRDTLGLKTQYPTNPQAEVLVLNGVPRKYIAGIIVLNEAMKEKLQAQYAGVDIRTLAQYFRYRPDYASWR